MTEYFQIELTQGQIARVSPEDWDNLSRYKWYAQWNPNTKSFYASRRAKPEDLGHGERVLMHRAILSAPKGFEVDHIHGNTLDNRRSEIRLATKAENQRNRGLRSDSTSGFKGVRLHGRRWIARIRVNGKRTYLGAFPTANEAYEAYCRAAVDLHEEFARVA